MPKKNKHIFFRSKVQIFAAIAWLIMSSVLTIDFFDSTGSIEDHLVGMSIMTGICLLAWGVPFGPLNHYLDTGKPMRPFKVDETKRKRSV